MFSLFLNIHTFIMQILKSNNTTKRTGKGQTAAVHISRAACLVCLLNAFCLGIMLNYTCNRKYGIVKSLEAGSQVLMLFSNAGVFALTSLAGCLPRKVLKNFPILRKRSGRLLFISVWFVVSGVFIFSDPVFFVSQTLRNSPVPLDANLYGGIIALLVINGSVSVVCAATFIMLIASKKSKGGDETTGSD